MSSVGDNSNQRIQNRISTAVNKGSKQHQLNTARRNFFINDDRLSSSKVMEQLLKHMGDDSFRETLNSFIGAPSENGLSGLMKTVVDKYKDGLNIDLAGANDSFQILTTVSNALISDEKLTVPYGQHNNAFDCLTCLYAVLKIAGRNSQFECVSKGELVDGKNETIEHSSDTAATNWCKSTMQLISDSEEGTTLDLNKIYDSLTLKNDSTQSIKAAAQGDATKDKVAMKLQEFISKDNKTIQAPKTLDEQFKNQLFEAIDSADNSSTFKTFVEQKAAARLVTTTETRKVNGFDVLVTTAKQKTKAAEAAQAAVDDAEAAQAAAEPAEAAPAADAPAADATYTFKTPQATTTFRTSDTVIEVNGIANIDAAGPITVVGDDNVTEITATITQQGESPIKCENATVSLTSESEVSVTGGTVTQKISGTTIALELNPSADGVGGKATTPGVTINNGGITMTGGDNQVGTLTLKQAGKTITITSPFEIETNGTNEVVIKRNGIGDGQTIKYTYGSESKDVKMIKIEPDGKITADGQPIGGDGQVGGDGGGGGVEGKPAGVGEGGGFGGVEGEGVVGDGDGVQLVGKKVGLVKNATAFGRNPAQDEAPTQPAAEDAVPGGEVVKQVLDELIEQVDPKAAQQAGAKNAAPGQPVEGAENADQDSGLEAGEGGGLGAVHVAGEGGEGEGGVVGGAPVR